MRRPRAPPGERAPLGPGAPAEVRRLPVVEVLGVGVVLGRAAEERAEHGLLLALRRRLRFAWRAQKPNVLQFAVCAYASPYRARRYVAWQRSHGRYDVCNPSFLVGHRYSISFAMTPSCNRPCPAVNHGLILRGFQHRRGMETPPPDEGESLSSLDAQLGRSRPPGTPSPRPPPKIPQEGASGRPPSATTPRW